MAIFLSSSPSYLPLRVLPPRLEALTTPSLWSCCVPKPNPSSSPLLPFLLSSSNPSPKGGLHGGGGRLQRRIASHLCEQEALSLDRRSLAIGETELDDELLAAVRLRVRTFYEFNQSYGIEDHKKYLVEREFEALKERILGKRTGFRRVTCINATLPLSCSLSSAPDLCSTCKFSENGEERVVIGSLDLNQCLRLADELTGSKPEGIEADITRAYLSNVCVAQELHRNGLGYVLISTSKKVAQSWGITDLYVHVAADNEAAKKLYNKSGFIYENEEPAWQARFLGRTRRFLLWADLKQKDL